METAMALEQAAGQGITEQTRIKAQATILRLEDLVRSRAFSRERLWREFLDSTAQELGSIALAVQLLEKLDYRDEKILELLIVSDYSKAQIVKILGATGWSDGRVASSVLGMNNVADGQADVDVLNFLLSSGISDGRVAAALHQSDCLYPKIINKLLRRGWDEFRLFKSIVEAKCFDGQVYQVLLLLGPKDKRKDSYWNDDVFLSFMERLELADADKVLLFKHAGKLLSQVYQLFTANGWSEDRIIAAFIEAGCSPGDVVSAYVDYSAAKISSRENYQSTAGNDYAQVQAEIELSKITAVTILEKMKFADSDVFTELYQQEWTNSQIIDYLLAASWTPERIIRAMQGRGWTEFFITKMINESADDYEFKNNNYWDLATVREWKTLLKKIFPKRDISKLIKL